MTNTRPLSFRQDVYLLASLLAGLTVLLVWCYWNSLAIAAKVWVGDAQYSHGWLVPIFAIGLLWIRGDKFGITMETIRNNTWGSQLISEGGIPKSARWAGAVLIALGLGGRLYCADRGFEAPELFTLIPALGGIFLMVGGWRVLQWSWPSIFLLSFMCPLGWTAERLLLKPLLNVATTMSTLVLQTVGFAAFQEGNLITLGPGIEPLNVVDACSGLRMLTIFLALTFAVAVTIDRPLWEKVILLISAVPIALVANVVRIVVTGIAHVAFHGTSHEDFAGKFFHDFAGLFIMMPVGMILLFLECMLLQQIFVASDAIAEPVLKKKGGAPSHRSRRGQRRRVRPSSMDGGSASVVDRESKIHREPKGHPEWATPKKN